jgi:DNA-directed RNA polymerase specialized sigma24 family protein
MPRLRVRQTPSNQLALPLTNQLALPLDAESRKLVSIKRSTTFGDDLEAVQRGAMTFGAFAKRHKPLIAAVVRPWRFRCGAMVGADDLAQELLLAVWKAICEWDEARGVPLPKFVRLAMWNKIRGYTTKLVRKHEKDIRYLSQQIIEEKVIVLRRSQHEGDDNDFGSNTFEPVSAPHDVDQVDVTRIAARIVGRLPSKQARVVAGLLGGESADVMTQRVYGTKCKVQRKAALRAISAAHALVQSS